jgi:hypothetical protein
VVEFMIAPGMALPAPARTALLLGGLGLSLAVINQATAPSLDPALQRASVLAGILSVLLMLAGALWERVLPPASQRTELQGQEGLILDDELPNLLREELAWGSAMLLTATPAAVVALQQGTRTLLRRGLLVDTPFQPGTICAQALERQRPISLVDLSLYPGREEFESLLADLPAVVVQPVGAESVLVVGGWSPRCFDRGDLTWIEGWARKLSVVVVPSGRITDAAAEPEIDS